MAFIRKRYMSVRAEHSFLVIPGRRASAGRGIQM
jgi:hypothetical protein